MLDILYEDHDVAVLAKPAGVAVHPAPHSPEEPALTKEILGRWPEIKGVGEDPLRPGIVHRLDKETSGVLVIAKHQHAFEFLKKQFQEHKVKKTYLALVVGTMPEREGEIRLPIGRSKKFGKFTTKISKSPISNSRELENSKGKVRDAATNWRLLKQYRGPGHEYLSFLELIPETGRTHQLRVHLAAIGHPVVGDKLYGGKAAAKYRNALGRHFLHAVSLEFETPAGVGVIRAEADVPGELVSFLESLRMT